MTNHAPASNLVNGKTSASSSAANAGRLRREKQREINLGRAAKMRSRAPQGEEGRP
jgi:hypothetical protein